MEKLFADVGTLDLWFLFVGGLLLAIGTVFAAVGRADEMKSTTAAEKAKGHTPGEGWIDVATFLNMGGAMFVAVGSMLAIGKVSQGQGAWAFWISLAGILLLIGGLIWATIRRRRMVRKYS